MLVLKNTGEDYNVRGVRGMLVLKIQGKIIMSGGSGACLFCKYRGRL